jgi:hypothetical protein
MCTRKPIPNCKLALIDGDCLLCEKNHYPIKREIPIATNNDYIGNECRLSEVVIDNCEFLYAKGKCAKCKEEHYIVENPSGVDSCEQFKNEKIENCKIYDKDSCLSCENEYYFDHSISKCVKNKLSDSDCISQNLQFNCGSECDETNYPSINLNSFSELTLVNNDRLLRQMLRFMALEKLGLLTISPFMRYYSRIEKSLDVQNKFSLNSNYLSVDQIEKPWKLKFDDSQFPNNRFWSNRKAPNFSLVQLLFPFCRELDENEKCQKCIEGFVLNKETNECKDIRIRRNETNSCAIWESIDQCLICNEGYELNNGGKCQKNLQNTKNKIALESVMDMDVVIINPNWVPENQNLKEEIDIKSDNKEKNLTENTVIKENENPYP